ncbi:MAG: hypothetical protein KAX44_01685, partial [Candidatus Brocadiae bacterium]|nr:hypothetical protein [Candidatus Brocadiia bacterium]
MYIAQQEAREAFENIVARYDHMDYYSANPPNAPRAPQIMIPESAIQAAVGQPGLERRREYLRKAMECLKATFERRRQDWLQAPRPERVPEFESEEKWRSGVEGWRQRRMDAQSGDVLCEIELGLARRAVQKYLVSYVSGQGHGDINRVIRAAAGLRQHFLETPMADLVDEYLPVVIGSIDPYASVRGAHGGAGSADSAAVPPPASDAESQGGPFTATLPGGVTVELLGVSYHPSEGQPWWRPDGTALPEPFCHGVDNPQHLVSEGYVFVTKVVGGPLPGDGKTMTGRVRFWPAVESEAAIPLNDLGRHMTGGYAATISGLFPAGTAAVDLTAELRVDGKSLGQALFRNVSLRPGHRTDVEVVVEPGGEGQGEHLSPSVSSADPDVLTFGPVIERVVNDDNADKDMFIDLDYGRLSSPPEDLRGKGAEAQLAWCRKKWVDAVADCAASVRGLAGFDMLVVPIPNATWRAWPDEVPGLRELLELRREESAPLPARRRPVLMSAKGELPATFVFGTREGGMGILQIVGFTEEPPGVKIRYKMVGYGGRLEARRSLLRQRLHALWVAIASCKLVHDGAYPPELSVLEEEGILEEDWPLEEFSPWGHQVQYRIPESDDPDEVILYHWPPFSGGTWLLFQDVGMEWVLVEEDGSLVNPRTGRTIRKGTQELQALVEDFFRHNFRDITARETLEWGEPQVHADGNRSIRYKFRATIWGKDVMTMNQVFTFSPDGQFVSVEDVAGYPQKVSGPGTAQPETGEVARLPIRTYAVDKSVSDFPEDEDLSTPEAAYATINRLSSTGDESFWGRLSEKRLRGRMPSGGEPRPVPETWKQALLNARILLVQVCADEFAAVSAHLPGETIRNPIDVRYLKLEDGRWLNAGNDRVNTVEQSKTKFARLCLGEGYGAVPAAEAPAGQAPSSGPFGPVIERVLLDANRRAACFIDLETGRVLSAPTDADVLRQVGSGPESKLAWVRSYGVDAAGQVLEGKMTLAGLDLILVPVAVERWDSTTAAFLFENQVLAIGAPGMFTPVTPSDELPATYGFKTREGGMGILQIVGFTEEPKGVKIRYK